MKTIFVSVIAILQQATATPNKVSPKPVCPLNEVYNTCGSACPLTCDNYNNPVESCIELCVDGCECQSGYVRNNADGLCCLPSECPGFEATQPEPEPEPQVCPLNEVYNTCGSACPLTCDNYKNPPQVCTLQCVIGCGCKSGYVRDEANKRCCLPSECPAPQPKPQPICPLNEEHKDCKNTCPLTCNNYKNPPKICSRICIKGCDCKSGYVRNEANKKCCLPSECPCPASQPTSKPQPACPLNEVYNTCGSACPLTCNNYKNPPQACTMQCVVGCGCKSGYVRDEANKRCCLPSECPAPQPKPKPQPACPLNEVYNTCGTSCPLTCDNYKNAPLICTRECNLGCECKKDYVRNKAGVCCLPKDC